MNTGTVTSIVRLLEEASAVHGIHEETDLGGVYDEEWAAWYATYLLEHGLRDFLPDAGEVGATQLSAVLMRLDADYRREQPASGWPAYYGARLGAMLERAARPGLPAAPR